VPSAHPDRWWGAVDHTTHDEPLFPADEPIMLSGSSLEGLTTCPLQWFLAHEARGEPARSAAVGFGSVVHALADDLGRSIDPHRADTWQQRLDQVWQALEFEARWQSAAERREADAALERLLRWHEDDRGRRLLATEQGFAITLLVGGRRVVLRGSMDRVEADRDGRIVVVDLKTMKSAPTGPEVAAHVQLGIYQLAVREGALAGPDDNADGAAPVPGGAELVQLRLDNGTGRPKVQQQPALPDDDGRTWIDQVLADGVARLDREDFAPDPVGGGCRYCAFHALCPAKDEGRNVL
jgi:RecB family exonuclease